MNFTKIKKPVSVSPAQKLLPLYEQLFPVIAYILKKRGANYEQARDIFQDSMVIYYERTAEKSTDIQNPEAYLTGIAKHLWYRRAKEHQRWIDFEDLDHEMAVTVDEYEEPAPERILSFLETTGRKCMELLKSFYFDQKSMEQIADLFGFSGTRSATVQKYKCLEKVRDQVKKEEVTYADFLE